MNKKFMIDAEEAIRKNSEEKLCYFICGYKKILNM